MRFHRRNLPGWLPFPRVQHHQLITVYSWGYWMVIFSTKQGRERNKAEKAGWNK